MNTAIRWHAPELDASRRAAPSGAEDVPVLRPPSLEDIQAIERQAHQEGRAAGFADGHAEGFAQGQAEVRRLTAQIEGILDNFTRPLARLESEVTAALGELAVRIAGSLIGRAYEADPALLAELVAEAVDAVGGTSREVEVRMHPEDIAAMSPLLALPAGIRLGNDPALGRGDLRVHAETVRIDATLDARMRGALERVLHKAGSAP